MDFVHSSNILFIQGENRYAEMTPDKMKIDPRECVLALFQYEKGDKCQHIIGIEGKCCRAYSEAIYSGL